MEKEKEKEIELSIVYLDIDELVPADYNPRFMTEEDRINIRKSLKLFGFVDPVIVNRHPSRYNVIVGGHQRTIVAKEDLNFKKVPCVFVYLELDKEKELNVRLNKNTGRFDNSKLSLHFTKEFLQEIGFKENELDFFLSEFEQKFNSFTDANAQMPIVPKFSEKYDSVIIISKNTIDTSFLETVLKIDTAKSYKNTRTGKAMIIDVEHFKSALYDDND